MRAKQDPLLLVGMPLDNQVRDRNVLAGHRVFNLKALLLNLGTKFLEALDQHRLLFGHSIGAANSWTDFADFNQVLHGGLAVKRIIRLFLNSSPSRLLFLLAGNRRRNRKNQP